jgi:hypothetical protein
MPEHRMIVVVEGISAAGKTTWCRQHANEATVPETGRRDDAPDPVLDPIAAASFWVEQGERRWLAACATERAKACAVCDTDPLKLHYVWSLWQIGAASKRNWQAECAATRDAIANGRLGFADVYLIKPIDRQLARQQRDSDPSRSRRNFELHVKLHDPLMAWYVAVEKTVPATVIWNLPGTGLSNLPARVDPAIRYSVPLFDQLINLISA